MKFLILLFLSISLFASLQDKSAIVYYGKDISYPTVGVHDYIIVQPENTKTDRHGFKLYKDKIYAYVSIGEIEKTIPQYTLIKKEWILARNDAWQSEVMDLKNKEYREFLFEHMIEPRIKKGFKNFFFDTLDSYYLASKNKKDIKQNRLALASFINEFHKRYPSSKLVVNRGFDIIESIYSSIDAVLFESYYKGIGGENLLYKDVSKEDREWLDIKIKNIKKHNLDVICVDYMDMSDEAKAKSIAKDISKKGMIPYVSNKELDIYGISAKNALKREIFVLINEARLDRTLMEAHQHGALVFEYMGYLEKLHDVNKGLPDIKYMRQYAGVVIWFQDYYKNTQKLINWVNKLIKNNIKVVFAGNFGFNVNGDALKSIGIEISNKVAYKSDIIYNKDMIGYEIEPSLSISNKKISIKNAQSILTYNFKDSSSSTVAAFTSWGGYAIGDSFMVTINGDNLWVINPFKFFKKALDLEDLPVADVTTQNGKRLLFTHIDGDGIMNRVEGDFGYYSGDVILNQILKVYKIPHSVSVIGAEISPEGLFPKISPKLIEIAKQMYALENVEPATHTFTHPFFWGKIKNNTLLEKYRLKPKGYKFSLENELSGTLEFINEKLTPKNKAKTVFWSGDCLPRENALSYVYKNNILNINGGDTTITRLHPWLSAISAYGIERDGYMQIYTAQQNENVFTNNWLGPFWGYKRVTQTFDLTNSPRRFKPIDIYYHLYSGSKQASLEALKYVFNYSIKQDVMPIFTSEYIPKVMDFYEVSLSKDDEGWLFCGLNDLNTIRIEKEGAYVDLNRSTNVTGIKHFQNHTYISLYKPQNNIYIKEVSKKPDESYMISSNAKIVGFDKNATNQTIKFSGHVDLKLNFYLKDGCRLESMPKSKKRYEKDSTLFLEYKDIKEATINISCL
jgi:hypothetical protein